MTKFLVKAPLNSVKIALLSKTIRNQVTIELPIQILLLLLPL
jgi:hypothetical protein